MSERLDRMMQYYSSIGSMDSDLRHDLPWLLQQAEKYERLKSDFLKAFDYARSDPDEGSSDFDEDLKVEMVKILERLESDCDE